MNIAKEMRNQNILWMIFQMIDHFSPFFHQFCSPMASEPEREVSETEP